MVLSKDKPQNQTAPAQGPGGMPPQVKMLQLMNAYRLTQSISVVAKLGIADLLADGPKSSEDLAQATGTHARSLYRLLRATASFGIFVEDENGLFALTPRGAMLQTNIPGSIRAYAIVMGEEWHWRMWGGVLHSVKTGEPAFENLYGMEFQEYYNQNPEVAENFDAAMVSALTMSDNSILASYDFSSSHKVVDIGIGGQADGKLIASILKKSPAQHGVYFDSPTRVEKARHIIESEGLSDRCQIVFGDVLESFPSGGDAYIIKNLIHDYEDERAIKILRNCHSAITSAPSADSDDRKVLIVEMIIPPGNEQSLAKILDVEALIMDADAIERTEEQYRVLLDAAGFKLTKVVPTRSPMSIIEAVPV